MSKNKWALRWYDAEEHVAKYANWDSLQSALKRLVQCGFTVEVSTL
jgi:hypothetical protein